MSVRKHTHSDDQGTIAHGPVGSAGITIFEPTFVEQVPIAWWRKLMTAVGAIPGINLKNITHEGILEAARSPNIPKPLLEALQLIQELAAEDVTAAFFEAAQTQGISTKEWPSGEAPIVRAVRLFLEQQGDQRLQTVFIAVQAQLVHTGRRRNVRDFFGSAIRPAPSDLAPAVAYIREQVRQWHQENAMGTHVDVRVFSESEESIHFQISHSHRLVQQMAETKEGARSPLPFYPVYPDFISYERGTGRLRIGPRSSQMVVFYQRIMGSALFDDPAFFQRDEVYTLAPLQKRGREALNAHGLPTILSARLVETRYRKGDHIEHIKGPDCFAFFHQNGRSLVEGHMVEAKIELTFSAGSRVSKRRVVIKVPGEVNFQRDEHEGIIERFLDLTDIKIRPEQHERMDLWTLHPWLHPLRVWRAVYGHETDHLVRNRLLVNHPLAVVANATVGSSDSHVLRVVEEHEGVLVGVSNDNSAGPRILTSTDIEGMLLDLGAVARGIASSLGLQGGVDGPDTAGLADLGRLDLGSRTVRIFMLARSPGDRGTEISDRIRVKVGSATPIVLVPTGQRAGTGLDELQITMPSAGYDSVVPKIVELLNLSNEVPAYLRVPTSCRFVIDVAAGEAWFDRQPLTALTRDTAAFKLLGTLARASGKQVPTKDIETDLSANRRSSGAAKRAKQDAIKAISASFENAGKERPPDLHSLIVAARGNYRLTVPCRRFG